jgi:hypothetical protein
MRRNLTPQSAAGPRNAFGWPQGWADNSDTARGAPIPPDGRFARLEKK